MQTPTININDPARHLNRRLTQDSRVPNLSGSFPPARVVRANQPVRLFVVMDTRSVLEVLTGRFVT